jgi:hypothetical protein
MATKESNMKRIAKFILAYITMCAIGITPILTLAALECNLDPNGGWTCLNGNFPGYTVDQSFAMMCTLLAFCVAAGVRTLIRFDDRFDLCAD